MSNLFPEVSEYLANNYPEIAGAFKATTDSPPSSMFPEIGDPLAQYAAQAAQAVEPNPGGFVGPVQTSMRGVSVDESRQFAGMNGQMSDAPDAFNLPNRMKDATGEFLSTFPPTAVAGGLAMAVEGVLGPAAESVDKVPGLAMSGLLGDAEGVAAKVSKLENPNFKNWFGGSKVVDAAGEPISVYHGSQRPDRIGNNFKKSRATSGPMSFFSDNPDVSSGYATGKKDTSIENIDYESWFKFKPKGSRSEVPIDRAWWHLSPEERQKISDLAPRIGTTDDGSQIVLKPEGHTTGTGGYDQNLKEAKGNHLKALVSEWLSSGNLYDQEEKFQEVLDLAGMKGVKYDSPWATHPGVYKVHLSIKNPLETEAIPPDVIEALQKRANRQPMPPSGHGADSWDKTMRDPQEWMRALREDVAAGKNSFVWSSIPDWVTDTLKKNGYDGIKDAGGKTGGVGSTVWIPFEESQVKSAIGNSGAYNPAKKSIVEDEAK